MKPLPPCIFPSVTEEDVVTVPGVEPCTAYRLRVEPGMGGYLRIEQLAYNEAMGWYTQKSFCLPGDVVHQLMPHLKQASALLPLPARGRSQAVGSMSFNANHNDADQHEAEAAGSTDACRQTSQAQLETDLAPLRFPGPGCPAGDNNTSQRKTS